MTLTPLSEIDAIAGIIQNPTPIDMAREEMALEKYESDMKSSKVQATLQAFGNYNPVTVMALSDSKMNMFDRYDPTYNPEDDMLGFEQYRDVLVRAKNPNHMMNMKSDIQRKAQYDDTISKSGVYGVIAALGAGVLDPIGLWGFGAFSKPVKGVRMLSDIKGKAKAASIGKASAKAAGGTALGVGVTEAVLQEFQPSLTAEESLMSIGAGAMLGGFFGGALKNYSLKEFDGLALKFKNDFVKSEYNPARAKELEDAITASYKNMDAGAAAVKNLNMEELSYQNTFGFANLSKFLGPSYRVMQSSSLKARQLYASVAELPLRLQGAKMGKAMPVAAETFAKQYDAQLGRAVETEKSSWDSYKKSENAGTNRKLTRAEFRARISKALRRDDTDEFGDPIITQAAKDMRENFFNPLRDAAIKADLLPEDIEAKFAASYLTRRWRPDAIVSDMPNFKAKLRPWAIDKIEREVGRITEHLTKKDARLSKKIDTIKQINDSAAQKIKEVEARQTTKYNYKNTAAVQDDYLEFIKREMSLKELGGYITEYGLDEIAELVNRAKATIPKMPQRLVSEIVRRGGIKPDGDLTARDITNKVRPALFSENGESLDVMLRDLIDDGFFPEYQGFDPMNPEKFMLDDLRFAIEDDLFGQGGVYRDADMRMAEEINLAEQVKEEAINFLNGIGYGDYKNFYKDIYEDLKQSKSTLRKGAKDERARLKGANQGARSVTKDTKVFRDELKKMRKAEVAKLKNSIRVNKTRMKKLQKSRDDIEVELNEAMLPFRNVVGEGYSEAVEEMVEDVAAQLGQIKRNPDVPPWLVASERGPMKNKLLDVNDVDFENYLENDIRSNLDFYRHQVGTQIELKNATGSIDLKDKLQEVENEYRELIGQASGKEAIKLKKEMDTVIKDIEGVRDVMLGTYNKHYDPDSMLSQVGVILRDINFTRAMGQVVLSSLPDIVRSPMVNGFSNFVDAAKMKTLSKELRKLSTEELQEMGLHWEAVLASRLQSLAEIGDPLNRGTAMTRFSGNAANIFSKFTLINQWNDIQKSLAALSTQSKLIKALNSTGDDSYLLGLGIDKNTAAIIKAQIKKHGDGNTTGIKNWDDAKGVYQASRIWKAAIRKETDVAIVTKSAGDLPRIANTPQGKVWLQFRTFMIASHGRVFLRALQADKSEAASTVLAASMMVGMGMAVAATKSELSRRSAGLRGNDVNYDTSTWNNRKWIVEGIDRSGLMAVIMEPLNLSDKMMGLGASTITGQGQTTRYGSRNVMAQMAGPSWSLGQDVSQSMFTTSQIARGEKVTKGDIHTARRLLPFQNAFIFGQAFDILENKTGEAIGAK